MPGPPQAFPASSGQPAWQHDANARFPNFSHKNELIAGALACSVRHASEEVYRAFMKPSEFLFLECEMF